MNMEKILLKSMLVGWLILLGAVIALFATQQFHDGALVLLIPFTLFGAWQTALELRDLETEND
jgi:hypothetical protein